MYPAETVALARPVGTALEHDPPYSLEVSPPAASVRLDVVSFGPLVPRLQEQQPAFPRPPGDLANGLPEYLLEPSRRGTGDYHAPTAEPRRVVPVAQDGVERQGVEGLAVRPLEEVDVITTPGHPPA